MTLTKLLSDILSSNCQQCIRKPSLGGVFSQQPLPLRNHSVALVFVVFILFVDIRQHGFFDLQFSPQVPPAGPEFFNKIGNRSDVEGFCPPAKVWMEKVSLRFINDENKARERSTSRKSKSTMTAVVAIATPFLQNEDCIEIMRHKEIF